MIKYARKRAEDDPKQFDPKVAIILKQDNVAASQVLRDLASVFMRDFENGINPSDGLFSPSAERKQYVIASAYKKFTKEAKEEEGDVVQSFGIGVREWLQKGRIDTDSLLKFSPAEYDKKVDPSRTQVQKGVS